MQSIISLFMGFIFGRKKETGLVKEYEQPYPELHKNFIELDKISDEIYKSTNDPLVAMEYIKRKEIELPTHWLYKYVVDPMEMRYRHRALSKSMIGQYDEAVKICHAGLANYPNSPYLLYILGRTLSDIGETTNNTIKLNAGFRILDRAIGLYPNFADAYIERAIIRELLNDPVGAKADYLKAESIEPGITRPYFEK